MPLALVPFCADTVCPRWRGHFSSVRVCGHAGFHKKTGFVALDNFAQWRWRLPGFLWFAVMPAHHWWFFPLLALVIVYLDWRRLPVGAETHSNSPSSALIDGCGHAANLPLFAGTTLLAAAAGFAAFLWYAALPTEPWYFIPLMALAAGCFEIGLPVRGHAARGGFGIFRQLLRRSPAW